MMPFASKCFKWLKLLIDLFLSRTEVYRAHWNFKNCTRAIIAIQSLLGVYKTLRQ